MVNRLELAKQYVQEMLEKRDDIVGAYVVGSVARGDATEASDVDLALIAEGQAEEEIRRGGIDTWREGVYIEAGLAPKGRYDDAENVLQHQFAATQMNDALILYDPSGTFTRVQEDVRSVYMVPKYVSIRVFPTIRTLRHAVTELKEALTTNDQLRVCSRVRRIAIDLPDVPLLVNGITPSSTRALVQLREVAPDLRERILEWEGSAALTPDDVLALLPIISESLALAGSTDSDIWGGLPKYAAAKATWMAENGMHREAFGFVWGFVGWLADLARSSSESRPVRDAERLAQDMLRAAGWEGQDVLDEKVRMAEEMVADVEAMASHLPLDEA